MACPAARGERISLHGRISQGNGSADEVRRLVDTVFDGSAEGLVMTLLECGGLTSEEVKRIRAMILASQRKRRKGDK